MPGVKYEGQGLMREDFPQVDINIYYSFDEQLNRTLIVEGTFTYRFGRLYTWENGYPEREDNFEFYVSTTIHEDATANTWHFPKINATVPTSLLDTPFAESAPRVVIAAVNRWFVETVPYDTQLQACMNRSSELADVYLSAHRTEIALFHAMKKRFQQL